MEPTTMRLFYFILIFSVGKSVGNFPTSESPFYQANNQYSNSLSSQLMNTVLSVANAKGVLPEVVSASRPICQQREQNMPVFQETVNVIRTSDVLPCQSTSFATKLQPLSIPSRTDTGFLNSPNLLTAQLPTLEIYPQNLQTLQKYPLRQEFFDNTPILNNQCLNNRYIAYDSGVNDVNFQTNVFRTISEVIDTGNTLVGIPDLSCNIGNTPLIPYNIEINLPFLTSTIPNTPFAPSNNVAFPPMPPIIIEESSKSDIWKWLPVLVGLLLNDNCNNNCCGCNNNCCGGNNNCCGCKNSCCGCNNNCCGCNCGMQCPYSIPFPTNNPIINNV